MKKEKVEGALVSNRIDKILVLSLPGENIKVFYWYEDEGFQETLKPPKLKTLAEAIQKAEKEIEIHTRYSKVYRSRYFNKLPFKKVSKIEEVYSNRVTRVWA